jgi:hypothetical protein
MFSTAIPGSPAWAQPPEVFDELIKVCLGSEKKQVITKEWEKMIMCKGVS